MYPLYVSCSLVCDMSVSVVTSCLSHPICFWVFLQNIHFIFILHQCSMSLSLYLCNLVIFSFTPMHTCTYTHSLSLLYTVQSIESRGFLLHCPILLPVLVSSSEWKAACLAVVNKVPPTVTFTENIATLWWNSICEHSEVPILDNLLHPDNVYPTVNSWQHYQFL